MLPWDVRFYSNKKLFCRKIRRNEKPIQSPQPSERKLSHREQSAFASGHRALKPESQNRDPRPGLRSLRVYSTELPADGEERTRRAEPAGPGVILASSISILDLARRSLRSKSRCFCSRSASRSVTCFCASASFWRSSVIWVERQRRGAGEGPGVNVPGSRLLLRGRRHAGCWECPKGPGEKAGSSFEFPSPSRYLLLVLLLHGPEVLVPLLVHFQQLQERERG